MKEFTHQDRVAIARATLTLLDRWGVEPAQQVTLLGLPGDAKPRVLNRYRAGTPLPDDPKIFDRVDLLFNIEKSLRHAFPHNAGLADYWVTTRCQYFNDATPLEVMLTHGMEGIEAVAGYLNASDAWW